ncbi:MAG: helix-turn-helix domain-containing protein, partial [Holophagales bacterium]|nr:helix-turn-helix domain-containing protein [Holophagales bacterium]
MGEKADTSSRSGKPRRESPSPTSGPIDDGPPRERVLTITELEQLKVLADPLRSRILERFAERARTTKQVAASLGEPPTKLYHHVDALERAGLIELVATRQNRGTLEKHYRAVARTFRADAQLLHEALQSLFELLDVGSGRADLGAHHRGGGRTARRTVRGFRLPARAGSAQLSGGLLEEVGSEMGEVSRR